MKYFLLAFYFLSSNQTDFDGKNLIFSGKFQIEHPMGLLKAEKAILKDLQLHHPAKKGMQLFLEDGVSIESTQGKTPFAISSQSACCELPPNTFLSFFQFQEIQFYEDVKITTILDIQAHGGAAFYKTGSLTLYPSVPLSYCQLERGRDQIEAQEIRFDFLKDELICSKTRGTLTSRINQSSFYFSAETLRWQKKEEKLTLSSLPPKRVLLWQEGFSLSAPEIVIQRDPLTGKEIIEGKGDVHFAFEPEEENIIEQLLLKYL